MFFFFLFPFGSFEVRRKKCSGMDMIFFRGQGSCQPFFFGGDSKEPQQMFQRDNFWRDFPQNFWSDFPQNSSASLGWCHILEVFTLPPRPSGDFPLLRSPVIRQQKGPQDDVRKTLAFGLLGSFLVTFFWGGCVFLSNSGGVIGEHGILIVNLG